MLRIPQPLRTQRGGSSPPKCLCGANMVDHVAECRRRVRHLWPGGEATDPHSLMSSNVAGESSTKFIAGGKKSSCEGFPLAMFDFSRMCTCFGKY